MHFGRCWKLKQFFIFSSMHVRQGVAEATELVQEELCPGFRKERHRAEKLPVWAAAQPSIEHVGSCCVVCCTAEVPSPSTRAGEPAATVLHITRRNSHVWAGARDTWVNVPVLYGKTFPQSCPARFHWSGMGPLPPSVMTKTKKKHVQYF